MQSPVAGGDSRESYANSPSDFQMKNARKKRFNSEQFQQFPDVTRG